MQRAKLVSGGESAKERTASERVIEAVADREGVEPTAIGEPLYTSVDPDALDALVGSPDGGPARSSVRVRFSYYGYDVVVGSDGSVQLSECA